MKKAFYERDSDLVRSTLKIILFILNIVIMIRIGMSYFFFYLRELTTTS